MNQVSIVIPVYGQWALVKLNIENNFQYDEEFIREVIVVDDCSPEPCPFNFGDKVKILRNEKNLGYTGTVNRGLRQASSEIIVLLDSDACPTSCYLEHLIHLYQNDVTLGSVGFSTVDSHNNDTGNFDYPPSVLGYLVGQNTHSKLKHLNVFKKRLILPFSCAVSFRKQCLGEMNYLDEINFPVLDADHDLSLRIHESQWKLIFDSSIKIFHQGGNSIPRNYQRVLLYHRSRWKLLMKHGNIQSVFLVRLFLSWRVRLEIILLTVVSRIKKNERANVQLDGRKILLHEIKDYQ